MPDAEVDPSKLRQKDAPKKSEVVDLDRDLHYEAINSWWNKYYGGDSIPVKCVPKHGCVIIFKGKPVASCFLYINDTSICHLDFCIVDPDLGAGNRVFFLRQAIEAGIKKARDIIGDDAIIWSVTDNAVVSRLYQEKGMTCMGEADVFAFTKDKEALQFLS